MDAIIEFYNTSVAFCRFVEEITISQETADEIIERLMRLYICGMHLPDVEPETIESDSDQYIEYVMPPANCRTYYKELFDPFEDEDYVGCDVREDLGDIRRDLMGGIKTYEAGLPNSAAFEWKLMLDVHWGKHATDAMRALHILRKEAMSE